MLAGSSGMLFHIEELHPHELPDFVLSVLKKLGLRSQLEYPCSLVMKKNKEHQRSEFDYPKDGTRNKLMVSPSPNFKEKVVKLSEVSEHMVMCWYSRDIEVFQQFDEENAKHQLTIGFDPLNPELSQIARLWFTSDGNSCRENFRLMCMHCQEPQRFRLEKLLGHMGTYHWPVRLPKYETLRRMVSCPWL